MKVNFISRQIYHSVTRSKQGRTLFYLICKKMPRMAEFKVTKEGNFKVSSVSSCSVMLTFLDQSPAPRTVCHIKESTSLAWRKTFIMVIWTFIDDSFLKYMLNIFCPLECFLKKLLLQKIKACIERIHISPIFISKINCFNRYFLHSMLLGLDCSL